MTRHALDGNSAAIDRHLDAIDAWHAAQPVFAYCAACDETISSHDFPHHVEDDECPNCGGTMEDIA